MKIITRERAKELVDRNDVTVVDVLSEDSFAEYHLPNARNVPLGEDFEQQIQQAVPEKGRAVLLYCLDEECQASEKAGKKMEQLGYDQIYEYAGGKKDWKSAGYPVER